jgi:hypothetical protein
MTSILDRKRLKETSFGKEIETLIERTKIRVPKNTLKLRTPEDPSSPRINKMIDLTQEIRSRTMREETVMVKDALRREIRVKVRISTNTSLMRKGLKRKSKKAFILRDSLELTLITETELLLALMESLLMS